MIVLTRTNFSKKYCNEYLSVASLTVISAIKRRLSILSALQNLCISMYNHVQRTQNIQSPQIHQSTIRTKILTNLGSRTLSFLSFTIIVLGVLFILNFGMQDLRCPLWRLLARDLRGEVFPVGWQL